MTLASHYAAATDKYGIFDCFLLRATEPIGNWQYLRIINDGTGYDLSVWYNPETPDIRVTQDDVKKVHEFRIRVRKNGSFVNMIGHINS